MQIFIDLVQRHEQAFYSFVHKVHSKGESLFDNFMRWISLFLTFIRDGLGEPLSLEFILPHTGAERTEILKEVDAVAVYHYKLKLAYEDKVRRRFARNASDAKFEDEAATQALVDSFVGNLDLGDLVDEAADLADSDEEDVTDSDEYDSDEYTTASSDASSDERPPARQSTSSSTRTRSRSRGPPHSHKASLDITQPKKNVRPSRSMTLPSRQGGLGIIPPVPPLPPLPPGSTRSTPTPPHSAPPHSDASKLLPTPPNSAPPLRLETNIPPASPRAQASTRSAGPSRRKSITNLKSQPKPSAAHPPKKPTVTLAHPELKAIPGLLPLFVEIVRDRLSCPLPMYADQRFSRCVRI